MDRIMHASALEIVLWNIPFAAGGCIIACIGGLVFHALPITHFMFFSSVAWILAPLLFAIASPHASYWRFVFPSMICATLGIDITYTISTVFLSAVQPLKYQGLVGSMCSVLLYLGMSMSVGVAEIVKTTMESKGSTELDSYRAAFFYAAGSASVGFAICVFGVRIPKVDRSFVD